MHHTFFAIVFRRHEVNCYRYWIFNASNVLRSFVIFFKYALILLRFYSVDSISFLLPLISCSIKLLVQKLPFLTGLQ